MGSEYLTVSCVIHCILGTGLLSPYTGSFYFSLVVKFSTVYFFGSALLIVVYMIRFTSYFILLSRTNVCIALVYSNVLFPCHLSSI